MPWRGRQLLQQAIGLAAGDRLGGRAPLARRCRPGMPRPRAAGPCPAGPRARPARSGRAPGRGWRPCRRPSSSGSRTHASLVDPCQNGAMLAASTGQRKRHQSPPPSRQGVEPPAPGLPLARARCWKNRSRLARWVGGSDVSELDGALAGPAAGSGRATLRSRCEPSAPPVSARARVVGIRGGSLGERHDLLPGNTSRPDRDTQEVALGVEHRGPGPPCRHRSGGLQPCDPTVAPCAGEGCRLQDRPQPLRIGHGIDLFARPNVAGVAGGVDRLADEFLRPQHADIVAVIFGVEIGEPLLAPARQHHRIGTHQIAAVG